MVEKTKVIRSISFDQDTFLLIDKIAGFNNIPFVKLVRVLLELILIIYSHPKKDGRKSPEYDQIAQMAMKDVTMNNNISEASGKVMLDAVKLYLEIQEKDKLEAVKKLLSKE